MREAVRSGRRANFFITENRFIDCYAAKVGGGGVAVYSILQRCANSETRETWISASKMAEVLDINKSTVYRHLKQLEDLRLIKSMRTREKTIYVVLPVPSPRPEAVSTPLFDAINLETADQDSNWLPVAEAGTSLNSEIDSLESHSRVASAPQQVASVRPINRASENRNKEEQDSLNKTQEQDLLNKTHEAKNTRILETAQRIIDILRLPNTFISTATAAVELMHKGTKLSMDGIVQDIVTTANHAERRGVDKSKFLEGFLAQTLAQQIVEDLSLTATNSLTSTVAAAVKAEAAYQRFSLEKAAALIKNAGLEDRSRGASIDRFYFENTKWRSNVRASKAEQRKLDNLEVNARVKQRIRERLGTS